MDTVELNKRDLRNINKDLKSIMDGARQQYLELNIALTDEDYNAIENAMLEALKTIKIKNKIKFTPKKYRK